MDRDVDEEDDDAEEEDDNTDDVDSSLLLSGVSRPCKLAVGLRVPVLVEVVLLGV
jgi:hypothetical protein